MKSIKRFFYYASNCRLLIAISLASALLTAGSRLYIPIVVAKAIDGMIGEGKVDFDIVATCVLTIGILAAVSALSRYVYETTTAIFGQNIVKKMRDEIFFSLNSVPVSYLDSHDNGDLVSRLDNDVENVQIGLVGGLTAIYEGVVTIFLTAFFMFSVNWVMASLVIVLTPISIFATRFIAHRNVKYFRLQADKTAVLASKETESLTNAEAVKSLCLERTRHEDFQKTDKELKEAGFRAFFAASWINPVTRLINSLVYAIMALAGVYLILNGGFWGTALEVGGLSAFLAYASQYMEPFDEISNYAGEISSAYASFKRVDEVVSAPKDSDGGESRLPSTISELKASSVCFSYEPGHPTIKNLSFEAKQGTQIAFVGATGSGKTTLISLLMRFYDPQSGAFCADGVSTLDVPKKELRKHLGMVLQETWIFSGTVYENVAYAKPEAARAEVIKACKEAEADSFIRRLPHGYDTPISDTSGLSAGERQLICIARVMLASPEIVILDEATSQIDTMTEQRLWIAMEKLMKGKISIMVAHRLSTAKNADLIMVMDQGQIVETGTHQSLLAKKDGYYKRLFEAQFKTS